MCCSVQINIYIFQLLKHLLTLSHSTKWLSKKLPSFTEFILLEQWWLHLFLADAAACWVSTGGIADLQLLTGLNLQSSLQWQRGHVNDI